MNDYEEGVAKKKYTFILFLMYYYHYYYCVDHLSDILEKYPTYLEEDKVDDVKRMYSLLHRLGATGVLPMRDGLEAHIVRYGRAEVRANLDEAKAKPDVFVALLLRVYRKFSELIEFAFDNNAEAIEAQDKAFRVFLNDNALTQLASKNDVAPAPMMLAKYCDLLMRGSIKIADAEKMEATVDDLVSLFQVFYY